MRPFDFLTPTQVTFGLGSLKQLPQLTRGFGHHVLVVGGRNSQRPAPVTTLLGEAGINVLPYTVAGEPTVEAVRKGVGAARSGGADWVIGCGGGSAMDAAKAIAALMTNSGEPLDYLEVVGNGQTLEHPPVPCVAIPTTAGTGAEVTRNAVLGSPEHGLKASLRGAYLLPRLALIDPEMTTGLPPELTAQGGFDTLTQLLEAFVSRRANALTDGFCREGLARVKSSLRAAYDGQDEPASRENMSFASLLSGLALANAELGAVHGFGSPLGGMTNAPHGGICAALLCKTVEVNARALRERQPNSSSLHAFGEAAELLTGAGDVDALLHWLLELRHDLKIQPLSAWGLRRGQIPVLVERAARASSMRGNPLDLTEDELLEIVEGSLAF